MFDYLLSHLQQRSSDENNLKMPASILLTIQTMQDSSTIQKNSYKIYDILINHRNSSINEIFTRQANLGGANLANIEYEDEWSFEQKQNIQILLQFYEQLNQTKL